MNASARILAALKKRRGEISGAMRNCPPAALDRLGARASEIERTIAMVEAISATGDAAAEPTNRHRNTQPQRNP